MEVYEAFQEDDKSMLCYFVQFLWIHCRNLAGLCLGTAITQSPFKSPSELYGLSPLVKLTDTAEFAMLQNIILLH